jgi:hypothetical protein
MPTAVVELAGRHYHPLPEQRVEPIGDLRLAPKTPGITRSHRTMVPSTGPCSLRSSRPAS